MHNDSVLPDGYNGSAWTLTTPTAVKKAQADKRDETLTQLPLLKQVVEHLEQKIAFYDSPKAVPDEVLTKPDEFMHVIAANKLTIANLQDERSFILGRIDSLKK